jgi:hypothetical protein
MAVKEWFKFVFDNSAGNPGTYPNCSQRTMVLLNYDSLADRNDATALCIRWVCLLWDGTSPFTGTVNNSRWKLLGHPSLIPLILTPISRKDHGQAQMVQCKLYPLPTRVVLLAIYPCSL